MRLLLLSNGTAPGLGYLEHVLPTLRQVLAGARRVAFVPYAQHLLDRHTDIVGAAMSDLDVEVVGVHRGGRPRAVVEAADAVFVGGGNAFRLLAALYEHDLLDAIRSLVGDGAPYVGTSAGTNVACPSIRTTNDMPILQPPTFQALGLVPFQINPHYPMDEVMGRHLGETRDRRIAEFHEDNDVAVLALAEGSWLQVDADRATVDGVAGGRLFRRAGRADVPVGADVSALLRSVGHSR